MAFGRNRETRSREAAERRNWPEAVPRKKSGGKRVAYCTQQQSESGTRPYCQLREKRIKSSISCTCRLARKYESQLGLAQSAAYRIG